MATNPNSNNTFQIPESLTLKDLITIVSIAVSLTVAWGVFSTRIAIVERELLNVQAAYEKQVQLTESQKRQIRRLETHQQDDELIIDQIYIHINKPAPVRRADP